MKPHTLGKLRSGYLTRMPEDFLGERHIAIVKSEPKGLHEEWCEFEERAGPAPPGSDDGGLRIYCTR